MSAPRKQVLVVGVGSIGERHTRCFLETGLAEVGIAEANDRLRSEIAARYHLERSWTSLEEALRSRWDAVVICTPAHLHIPMAIQCLQHDCHVLIEKPLSIDRARVDELAALAASKRRVVGVAYVLRCHAGLAAMREALLSGRFGRPVQIIANSGQHFPTYRPAYRQIYYAQRSTGGGAIQDALTHMMNAGEWLVGPVTRLTADADHKVLEGVTVEDTVHVITRHSDVMGCFSLNQHQAPNEFTITVVCERGTLRFEAHQQRFRWLTEPGGEWHDEPREVVERDTLFIRQAARFLAALNGEPVLCSLSDGEQTLRVNLAVLAAAEGRCWVDV